MNRRVLQRLALGVALAATALPMARARAQYYSNIGWMFSFPTGDTKDFTGDNYSWLGFFFEGRKFIQSTSSAGFYFGYNEFWSSNKNNLTFKSGNGTITGQQYRDIVEVPLLLTAHYYPQGGTGNRTVPFLGLGAGAYWVEQYFTLGTRATRIDHWHFGIMPQIGIAQRMGSGTLVTLSGSYHVPFNAGNYLGGGGLSPQYWALSVGIAYESR